MCCPLLKYQVRYTEYKNDKEQVKISNRRTTSGAGIHIRQRRVKNSQKVTFSSQNSGSKRKVLTSQINIIKDWFQTQSLDLTSQVH